MAGHVRDVTAVLHIGLHKTATTYVQNVLSTRRYDLLEHGVLYPDTGTSASDHLRTRHGAQSGHILLTRPGKRSRGLVGQLVAEVPEGASHVLVSSEDFSRPDPGATPEQHLSLFEDFGAVEVVLVVRRQDDWVESLYKQLVDQYGSFEVRSLADFLAEEGPRLLDLHDRFSAWRDLVGPERFHVLSYDDLDGAGLCRALLEVAGVAPAAAAELVALDHAVPRYDSVRSVDTLGLRLLNAYRLTDRDERNRAARAVYDVAPAGEVELLTPQMREAVQERCAAGNERIEAEWCDGPVPGFRFGAPAAAGLPDGQVPGEDLVRYVDDVLAICESARARAGADGPVG